jgi:hypothetical protein
MEGWFQGHLLHLQIQIRELKKALIDQGLFFYILLLAFFLLI